MILHDMSLPQRGAHGTARRRSTGGGVSGRIGAGLAVLLTLLIIGWGVAVALDSVLLAIVAVGMLFLVGVATTGAVNQGHR